VVELFRVYSITGTLLLRCTGGISVWLPSRVLFWSILYSTIYSGVLSVWQLFTSRFSFAPRIRSRILILLFTILEIFRYSSLHFYCSCKIKRSHFEANYNNKCTL
jgi:hypothetical protein